MQQRKSAGSVESKTHDGTAEVNTNVATEDSLGYRVYQSIKLQVPSGRKEIIISILEDKRLNGPGAKFKYYPPYHATQLIVDTDPAIYEDEIYKPVILLLKNTDGTIISRKVLEVSSARLDTVYLDESRTQIAYLFTKDYSTGMGSYNGPITYFVHFTDSGMVYFKGENGFISTLKSGWALRYSDTGVEVWSKLCRPANDDFNIIISKCALFTDSFNCVKSIKKGFWENDGSENEGIKELFENFAN